MDMHTRICHTFLSQYFNTKNEESYYLPDKLQKPNFKNEDFETKNVLL